MGNSVEFDQESYENFKKEFENVIKKIKNYKTRPLPEVPEERKTRVNKYVLELVTAYNDFVKFMGKEYPTLTIESKNKVQERIQKYKQDVLSCLTILGLFLDLPIGFCLIDINKITKLDLQDKLDNSQIFVRPQIESTETQEIVSDGAQGGNTSSNVNDNSNVNATKTQDNNSVNNDEGKGRSIITNETSTDNGNFSVSNSPNLQSQTQDLPLVRRNMAFEYIGNLSRVIKDTYDGDPGSLSAFVASIELANAASEANQQDTLVKFIKSKLTGRALEIIVPEHDTAQKIIDALKSKIRPENTKVVVARLLALRAEKSSMQKFQEQADSLTDALRRSYISDGIPHELAMSMTIDKTVEMCRLSAKSSLVKSVLAATKFTEPKEVLAKFITEANQENSETRILAFGNQNTNGNGNNFRRGRGNFGSNNRGNKNNGNGQNNYFRNNYNNNNNQFRGNFRGRRGRGRGYFNNNNNGQNGRNNNERYIRIVQENGQGPSYGRAQQNEGNPQAPNEHVIRIPMN